MSRATNANNKRRCCHTSSKPVDFHPRDGSMTVSIMTPDPAARCMLALFAGSRREIKAREIAEMMARLATISGSKMHAVSDRIVEGPRFDRACTCVLEKRTATVDHATP